MNNIKIVILLIMAGVIILFSSADPGKYLTLEALKENGHTFADFHETHRVATVVIFMLVYISQTALSLPGAAIFSLAAGALFGAVMGTFYTNIAATIGATLAFLVTRYLFHDLIQNKFGCRLNKLNMELEKSGLSYLLFLRLVPLFPFFLINLSAGLTKLPLRTFFFGTMIGIIPGSFVYCNAGASLASITSMGDIVSPRMLGSFALLGLFALIPVFYSKYKGHRA